MKIGFIGLGNLGRAMVGRLVSQGFRLYVWNRTKSKANGLDVSFQKSPAEVVKNSDIILLNLFDSKAVKDVLENTDGLLSTDLTGKVIIDTTTNNHRDVLTFYKAISKKGGSYIEAPVLGSVVPASKGQLTILVSGDKYAFEKVKLVLEILGSKIFFLEKPGLATKMKLINNLLLGVFMVGISESLLMAEKSGISLDSAIEILMSGAGNSMVLSAKKDKILNDNYSPHFSNALIYKDLHYLQDLAFEMKQPLFTASVVKELYAMAYLKGCADLDFSYIFKILKDLAI